MIILLLIVLGLAWGSFDNALVWRIRQQDKLTKKSKLTSKQLSILNGRSMCPNCKHILSGKDLVPVFSWLSLGGKCRYCKKPISYQYPLVELITSALFVFSYFAWLVRPEFASMSGQWYLFTLWLAALVGLVALAVYDLKWFELPDKLVMYVTIIALGYAITSGFIDHKISTVLWSLAGGAVLFSLFWIIFQISSGKWMGGGDVKLSFALGVLAGTPVKALLLLFIASILGSLLALILSPFKKITWKTKLPFGPYLIAATLITVFYGNSLINWYVERLGS